MDKNMTQRARAIAKEVQTNGWNMNVHIAMSQSTVPWSVETCRRPAIVTSSFESEAVSSCADSPTHALNVASKFNLVRKVAGYKARTRRQMEKHVPREVGSSTNPRPASQPSTTGKKKLEQHNHGGQSRARQAAAKTLQGRRGKRSKGLARTPLEEKRPST